MSKYLAVILFVLFSLWTNSPTKAQGLSAAGDTTAVEQETGGNGGEDGSDGDELYLDAIEIKGRVEKPSVIILPKRIDPEVGEIELEREFEQELKEGIGEILRPEEEMSKVERVQSIKQAIERDRE
jgi:hypothetical protein